MTRILTKKNYTHNKIHKTKHAQSSYDNVYTIIEPLEKHKRVLDFTLMRSILHKYKLNECNQFKCMNKQPMFVWLNYDENSLHWLKRKYYNTNIYLQNSLTNTESITNKDKLHLDMQHFFPTIYNKHLAHSFLLQKTWKYKPSSISLPLVYIARPINILETKQQKGEQTIGYGGKDIVIVHNNTSLEQAKHLLQKYDNILISNYITNPLLFNGHKCHIRTFLLASILNNTFSTYTLNNQNNSIIGRIFTAKLPYTNTDWNNPDIHDTHMKSTPQDWFYPNDFNDINIKNIDKQIKQIFTAVSKLLSKTVKLYNNVHNGFNIFGIDLMIKDDFTVILIECNAEGTYKSKETTTHTKLEQLLFNWINNVIFKPLFNNTTISQKPLFSKKIL